MKIAVYLVAFFICGSVVIAQPVLPYKNSKLPIPVRVEDLLYRMTPEEKFWQMFMMPGDLDDKDSAKFQHGIFGLQVSAGSKGDAAGQLLAYNTNEDAIKLATKINGIQHYFVEHTRLGIPMIPFDEALHGLVREGATAFPQAIALAATWDTALVHRAASVIASQSKARGIRDILSPVVNIASDVRWGRTEETYGEDPFLTSRMGVAFVSAFEKQNIITTPKHFVANVGDGGRDSYPIHWNERLMNEIYFPPFQACFKDGGSRSVMTSYNSVDGVSATASKWLLQDKLKNEWGFKGFSISDANAVGGTVVLHNTAKDYPESGKNAINAGLDVIFQVGYDSYKLFMPPFFDGSIDTGRINDAVRRVLTAKFELGLFENPYISEDPAGFAGLNEEGKKAAKQVALESIVLLQNKSQRLPLSKQLKTIAVLGEDAVLARLGGYSGPGNQPVNILKGIQEKLGNNTQVLYTKGASFHHEEWQVIDGKYLSSQGKPGLQGTYFNNIELAGSPALQRTDARVDFLWTLYGPAPIINKDFYSVLWEGELLSPVSGEYKLGLDGNDGYRLFVDDKLLIDRWQKQTYTTSLVPYRFTKDQKYKLRIEFREPDGNAKIRLIWNAMLKDDAESEIAKAVALTQNADVAIVVAGIHEGEFQDRAYLSLPGKQEELIKKVAATGKPVVVVLVGGSAITMSNWKDSVDAILDAWYPGEEGGHAVADILFGDENPAGRLPITFPIHESQLPLVYNHKPTGRGDDYYNLSGLPLFPFGYGLSYTQFSYNGIRLSKEKITSHENAVVSFTITNTGKRAGDEVVQLYIRDELASVARPVQELKGFQRIHLMPGESKQVSFTITPEMLSMLNADLQRVVEPGNFRIMIGASSRDIRLKQTLAVGE